MIVLMQSALHGPCRGTQQHLPNDSRHAIIDNTPELTVPCEAEERHIFTLTGWCQSSKQFHLVIRVQPTQQDRERRPIWKILEEPPGLGRFWALTRVQSLREIDNSMSSKALRRNHKPVDWYDTKIIGWRASDV